MGEESLIREGDTRGFSAMLHFLMDVVSIWVISL